VASVIKVVYQPYVGFLFRCYSNCNFTFSQGYAKTPRCGTPVQPKPVRGTMKKTDSKIDDVFDKFIEVFDATNVLGVVGMIDEIGTRAANPSGLRDDLLKFYTKASLLIDQGPDSLSPDLLQELTDAAADICMELDELVERLSDASSALEPLAKTKD
jgi:hypothetical protein